MKKNKKGFTLIELLAVIVVLAIVLVIATSTVLPMLNRARQNAFAIEANSVIDAASQAVSLIQIGQFEGNQQASADYSRAISGDGTTTYCFSMKKLVDLQVLKKDQNSVLAGATYDAGAKDKYQGTVTVTVPKSTNGAYTYHVEITNNNLYVKETGNVTDEQVNEVPTSGFSLKASCN